jgi:protein involved in polysaccharide export with SLBB domain
LVDLKEILANPASKSNYILKDNDILGVYSYAAFTDESKVEISGSIRTEGEFKYQSGMTLGDLLFLAGGLKFYGNNLRVEISRMSIFAPDYVEGAPAKILSYKLQIPRNNFDTSAALSYKLLPFDKVYIRNIVDFTYQKTVTLNGEVKYPGEYTLLHKDERIDDLVKRAGGLTKFAFPESASISRPTLRGENLVMNLKSALKSHNNKYNYVLKEGDVLTVPTVNDYVAIVGSSIEYLTVLNKEQVNAPYVNGRRARYYVNEFGNGFTKNAWRKKTYVVQPSAKINKTINLLVFNIYPKVTKGSTIYVVEKPVKNKKEKDPNAKPVDWNKMIENTMVKITGVLTLYLLFAQLK